MQNRIYTRREDTAISDNIERVCNFLFQLKQEKFFGDLNLKFQDGEIVLVNQQRSFKPNFLVVVEQHRI